MEKKTPLYEAHLAAGGKMVPFGGYILPVQYGQGVIAEHQAVRTACGIFDVSHMGEFLLTGASALESLNRLLTNSYDGMSLGRARYSPMCNEAGGVVDDLLVYKKGEEEYFIVVNAANRQKDFEWMSGHLAEGSRLEDISNQIAQIALQGPNSQKVLEKIAGAEQIPEKYYTARFDCRVQGMDCILSRTGYTGEDGFEIYLKAEDARTMWDLLLKEGAEYGLIPCGLGARDTLRLEAAMPLYGHELTEEITPLEAGLDPFVKMNKADFIGKAALEAKGEPTRRRVGLKVTGRGVIREGAPLLAGDRPAGVSTSGTHCPYLGYPVAMALVEKEFAQPGQTLTAQVRGRQIEAQVVALPFYKRNKG